MRLARQRIKASGKDLLLTGQGNLVLLRMAVLVVLRLNQVLQLTNSRVEGQESAIESLCDAAGIDTRILKPLDGGFNGFRRRCEGIEDLVRCPVLTKEGRGWIRALKISEALMQVFMDTHTHASNGPLHRQDYSAPKRFSQE